MPRGWLVPVALFLALACTRAAFWSVIHDEGGTYDLALYHLDLSDHVPPKGEPIGLADALESSAIPSFDELLSVLTSRRSMHPPLYYVLAYGWTQLFGSSAVALRIPGIAIGAFAVFAMFHLARALTHSDRAATWASLLLAVSPAHVGFAVYLRPYGLEIAIAISSCLALLRWHAKRFERGEWRWFAAFTLLSALGIYTLYHYLFVLLFQFAFLGIAAWLAPKRSTTADLGRAIGCGVGVVLLYAPWLPHLVATTRRLQGTDHYFAGFTPLAEWPNDLYQLAVWMTLGHPAAWRQVAFLLLVAGLVSLVVMIRRQKPQAGSAVGDAREATGLSRTHRIFLFCFPVYPVAMIAADFVRDTHTFLVWKTSIIMLPLAILAIVLLLQRLRRPRMREAALGLCTLVVFAATLTNVVAATFGDRRGQHKLARHVLENDRDDHVVVLNLDKRGPALTTLVHWRNLGVSNVRIALAPPKHFESAVASLASDPDVIQITLVNFRVGYAKKAVWSKEKGKEMVALAEDAGKEARIFRQKILYSNSVGE